MCLPLACVIRVHACGCLRMPWPLFSVSHQKETPAIMHARMHPYCGAACGWLGCGAALRCTAVLCPTGFADNTHDEIALGTCLHEYGCMAWCCTCPCMPMPLTQGSAGEGGGLHVGAGVAWLCTPSVPCALQQRCEAARARGGGGWWPHVSAAHTRLACMHATPCHACIYDRVRCRPW